MGKEYGWTNTVYSSAKAIAVMCLLSACSSVLPSQYIDQAEPDVTLTALASNLDGYREKIVILGGVIVDEKQIGEHVFLRLKNRPLDKDYRPHRPLSLDGPEAGYYWVTIGRSDLPEQYHQWARVTVVGQVAGARPSAAGALEPVLVALYLRGWGDSVMNSSESTVRIDRNRSISVPKGARGEFSQQ
ncbi:MAG TPA: Slp family lipoprotein [Nitrospiraceae bacterium]|nr:Slp family lipoprotein [Nitrospiraceae bacterium]